jgi:hypothetical protein
LNILQPSELRGTAVENLGSFNRPFELTFGQNPLRSEIAMFVRLLLPLSLASLCLATFVTRPGGCLCSDFAWFRDGVFVSYLFE